MKKIVILGNFIFFIYAWNTTLSAPLIDLVKTVYVKQDVQVFPQLTRERWLVEPWTGNDKPYVTLRKNIDITLEKGKLTPTILESYRMYAKNEPTNPIALFRWGYASFMATQQTLPVQQKVVVELFTLEKIKFPRSYEFARLCFLVATRSPHPRYEPFGEFLLVKNPHDFEVMYATVMSLDPTVSAEEKQKALQYAQRLLQMRPTDSRSFSAIGGVNYYIWLRGHDPEAGQAAIAAYRKYLIIGRTAKNKRDIAISIINIIQRG